VRLLLVATVPITVAPNLCPLADNEADAAGAAWIRIVSPGFTTCVRRMRYQASCFQHHRRALLVVIHRAAAQPVSRHHRASL